MICDMIWYDMIWYDMIWYDMIWSDMIWYDIWYDMIWYVMWYDMWYDIWYDMICLLTAIVLAASGSSTVHIYTQTIHRTTQLTTSVGRLSGIQTQSGQTNWEECRPCPGFASCTLTFALQLRKKHGKTSVRVAEECQVARWKENIQNRTYITIKIHKHNNKNT